jgi:hypothetical protein
MNVTPPHARHAGIGPLKLGTREYGSRRRVVPDADRGKKKKITAGTALAWSEVRERMGNPWGPGSLSDAASGGYVRSGRVGLIKRWADVPK